MITNFIENRFIKQKIYIKSVNTSHNTNIISEDIPVQSSNNINNNNTNENLMRTRTKYGYISGVVGICVNLILVVIELIIGIISNSYSITTDALHNIGDITSGIVTIISFKTSSLKPTKEYPFGFQRLEYIFSMLVGLVIIGIGIMFMKNAVIHIFYPQKLSFRNVFIFVMGIGILLKLFLSRYYNIIGNKINSSVLKSSAKDAKSDIYILVGATFSLIIFKVTGYNFDSYISLCISVMILHSGYYVVKDAISNLIGKAPDEELSNNLINYIKQYPIVQDVYGLVLNDYGINNQMVSLHVKINNDNLNIKDIDKIIDKIEEDVDKKFLISVCIEVEPMNDDN